MNSIFCYFQLFFARSSSLDVKNFKMPGNKCRVKDCESTQYHRGISLHRFPFDQKHVQILEKWIEFVNIPSFKPSKTSRICSLHFLDSDYFINHLGKKCLNRQAIPTVTTTIMSQHLMQYKGFDVVMKMEPDVSKKSEDSEVPEVFIKPEVSNDLAENFATNNPWHVTSIYEYQLFNCPECPYKNKSKQEFVNHANENHNLVNDHFLNEVSDDSLDDVNCPWMTMINTEEFENGIVETEEIENTDPLDCVKTEPDRIEEQLPSGRIKIWPNISLQKEFMDENTSEIDGKTEKQEEMIPCDLCNEEFQVSKRVGRNAVSVLLWGGSAHLKKHVHNVHNGGENLKCDICGTSVLYYSKQRLEEHIKQIHKCDHCGRIFKVNRDRQKHMLTVHEGKKRLKCERCLAKFKNYEEMDDHVETCDKTHTCDQCGKLFQKHHNMVAHIRLQHTKIKDYKCEYCAKEFVIKSQLQSHILLVHENVKPFQCEECGGSFSNNQGLKIHIKTVHRGIKEFTCDQCDKAFSRKAALLDHIANVHDDTNATKYECELCDKTYYRKEQLKKHVAAIHDKVKNVKCNECGKEFFYKNNYLTHMKTVHQGVRKFKCQICDKPFDRLKILQKHCETVHNQILEYNDESMLHQ